MKRKIGEKNSDNMKELWQDPEYREKMGCGAGHEHSVETKEKISKSLKGKRKSPETIEKMREVRKNFGKTLSTGNESNNTGTRRLRAG